MLSQNVLHFDVDSKRKLLTAAVLGNGIKRRKLWDINRKPEWWPADVPFRSPNAQPKCSVMELDKVLEKCNAHFVERFGPEPLEVDQHGMGVDREVDEEADRAIEQHSEQYGENAIDPEEYTWNTAERELFLEGIGDVTSPALLKKLLKVLPDHCPYPFTSSVGRKDIKFWDLGMRSNRLLLDRKTAVPTIHSQDTFICETARLAFSKRERARTLAWQVQVDAATM
eukprot:gene9837-18414_t